MATIDNDNDSIDNVTGAVIFAAYVFAALFLTGLIAFDLYQAYHSRSGSSSKEAQHVSNQLQIFVALAVLSFSTLSYHMLSYLIDSYQDWVTTQRFGPIHGLYSPGVVLGSAGLDFAGRVWQWLTQSTLFRDFAVTICKDSANFWWTQQALLVTMASALFMSIEGE